MKERATGRKPTDDFDVIPNLRFLIWYENDHNFASTGTDRPHAQFLCLLRRDRIETRCNRVACNVLNLRQDRWIAVVENSICTQRLDKGEIARRGSSDDLVS